MSESLEIEPGQPAEVVHAVVSLLESDARTAPDPWWRAGIDEALADQPAED